jgi:Tfp pilus assembly protein PilW
MTLVELMIALLLGLIVIGGALGLIVSMMKSNNDTIRAARLTQELRAMADIATMEIRRARSLTDPLANVGVGGTAFVSCNPITATPNNTTADSCLVFAYNCNPQNGDGQFRSLRNADGKLVVAQGTTAQTCTTAGTELNSDELVIDLANFSTTATGAVRLSLQGHLSSDATMTRTITRVVWPRSAPVVP